jgi:hypothetical protein
MTPSLIRFAAALVALCVVAAPAAASPARQATPECAGAAEWHAAVPDPALLLGEAGLSAEAMEAPRATADRLRALTPPPVAVEANTALVAAFEALVRYQETSLPVSQTLQAGMYPAFTDISAVGAVLSDARHKLLDGYWARTTVAAQCGLAALDTPGADDCGGVARSLGVTNEVIKAFWTYWLQRYEASQQRAAQQAQNYGELIAPSENFSTFAFVQALTLAATPAPEAAREITAALIANLAGWSDLGLIGVTSIWATIYQLDAATQQQYTAAYQQQGQAVLAGYATTQTQWQELATRCGVATRLPDVPAPLAGA